MASNISNMLNTRIRMSGMASGLDTESIVSKLMEVEKLRVNKVKQDKTLLEWKRDAYRDVTSQLKSFRDKYFDLLSGNNLKSATAFSKNAVSVSDPTVVKVTASGDAVTSNHTVNVTQVASVGAVRGTEIVGGPYKVDFNPLTVKMTDFTKLNIGDEALNIGGESYKVGADETVDAFMRRVNSDKKGVAMSFDASTQKFSIVKDDPGAGVSVTGNFLTSAKLVESVPGKFESTEKIQSEIAKFDPNLVKMENFTGAGNVLTIGSNSYTANSNETVATFINRVNLSTDNKDIRISYDSMASKFVYTSKNTGETIVNISGSFAKATNLVANQTDIFTDKLGKNAEFTIDGIPHTDSKTNDYTLDGITYTMQKVGTSTVTLAKDTEGIFNNIKSFVEDYNKLLGNIMGKTTEKKNRDYVPLTEEQKKDMKEEDIKLWEDKAKSGILAGDGILRDISTRIRSAFSSPITIGAEEKLLNEIGISTGNYFSSGKGIVINEEKLKDALAKDPDKVMNLFTKQAENNPYLPNPTSAEDGTKMATRFKENGLIWRLDDILNDTIRTTSGKGSLLNKAGMKNDSSDFNNSLQKMISDKDDAIQSLLVTLADKEDQYYKKFTAMEKAISSMNSQSAWISQQFGG